MWAPRSRAGALRPAQEHGAVDSHSVGAEGVAVRVGEGRLVAGQLAADLGTEQPDLAGALRLTQEHGFNGHPVGAEGVAVGVGEGRLRAVKLAADVGPGKCRSLTVESAGKVQCVSNL
jgi:hypothetical protein